MRVRLWISFLIRNNIGQKDGFGFYVEQKSVYADVPEYAFKRLETTMAGMWLSPYGRDGGLNGKAGEGDYEETAVVWGHGGHRDRYFVSLSSEFNRNVNGMSV